MNIIMVA